MFKAHPPARLALGAAGALALGAGPVRAHSFGAGTDAFAAFFEGASAFVLDPYLLLPCLALGLLLSLWQAEGMLRAWPYLLAGHIAGFGLAPLAGPVALAILTCAGALVAVLAALLPRHHRGEAVALAFVTGLLTLLVMLQGHAPFEFALPVYVGILAGASFAVAAAAGLAQMALERVDRTWVRIALRVAASWLAAIQILMAAMLLTATG